MVEPETSHEVLERLFEQGYTEDFKAEKTGMRVIPYEGVIDPSEIIVDKIYRFEDESDIDDEEIIFALHWPSGDVKGTYIVAFGPMMDPVDSQMVLLLRRKVDGNQHG